MRRSRSFSSLGRTNSISSSCLHTPASSVGNLLGSTTAKVLNDADCPVLTTQHAETISPRPLERREWACAIGSGTDSERVLRYASQAAEAVHANLTLVSVNPPSGPDPPAPLDLEKRPQSATTKDGT